MIEKKLWQVGWDGGQTEGDVGEQTVQELLNVELDMERKLRSRDSLVLDTSSPLSNCIDVGYMVNPANPLQVCAIYLNTNGLNIVNLSTGVSTNLEWKLADGGDGSTPTDIDSTSELEIHGNDIYVSASVSGSPFGLYHIYYVAAGKAFRPPTYLDGGAYDYEINNSATWTIALENGIKPELKIFEVTEDRTAEGYANSTATYFTDTTSWVGTYKNRVALAVCNLPDRDFSDGETLAMTGEEGVSNPYSVSFMVQFQYRNGQYSDISNVQSFNAMSTMQNQMASIGVTVSVSVNLSRTIGAINVYRKISKQDGTETEFELLFTANVDSNTLAMQDEQVASGVAGRIYSKYEYTSSSKAGGTTNFYAWQWNPAGLTTYWPGTIYNELWVDGVASYQSGWLNFSTNVMTFAPRAMFVKGGFIASTGLRRNPANGSEYAASESSAYYYKIYSDTSFPSTSVFAMSKYIIPSSNVYPIGTSHASLYPGSRQGNFDIYPITTFPPKYDTIGVLAPYWDLLPAIMIHKSIARIKAKYPGTTAENSANTVRLGDSTGNTKVMLFYIDSGEASISSLRDIIGADVNEFSSVKHRHITATPSRLLSINVNQDGEERPSRLIYSEFRRFGTFRKSNYIDYGPRDDGSGMAIGYFGGRLLVMHSTSSYIVDVSGGSDMSWRELAAYQDIGIIHSKAFVVASVGIFMASQHDIYFFDGGKLTNISNLEGRRVTDAYNSMNKSNITMLWRSDMRQLWVCDGTLNILVFDIDRGAWHKHTLPESISGRPLKFVNISSSEYLIVKGSNSINTYKFVASGTSAAFPWGLTTGEVTMGSSEITKKMKSLYVETSSGGSASGDIGIWYSNVDNVNPDTSIVPGTSRIVSRKRCPVRGPSINIRINTIMSGGVSWKGILENIGFSYKPKRLK